MNLHIILYAINKHSVGLIHGNTPILQWQQ